MSNLMNGWKELIDLMQGLPRASDQYNQVVGDAVVAVDRGIEELEASLEICSREILRLEAKERELEAELADYKAGNKDLKEGFAELEAENEALKEKTEKLEFVIETTQALMNDVY